MMKWVKGLEGIARALSGWNSIGKNDRSDTILKFLKISPSVSALLQNGEPHMVARAASHGSAQSMSNDPQLDREFLEKLWALDRKIMKARERKERINSRRRNRDKLIINDQGSLRVPFGKLLSGASAARNKLYNVRRFGFNPPPINQSTTGYVAAESPEEAQVAYLLARSTLLVTRDIEWANLMLGFEQENRYAIVDVCYPQSPVGFIRERSNLIARQLLRTRRPFRAYVTDAMGNELFQVRRPFWWITSSIYAEINGKEVGVVHRRWHLWRRNYDLYLGNTQFAVVENPGLWNWTFTLKDIDGNVLAQIDRDWRGFGFELFTDAGQYVIRFGTSNPNSKNGLAAADLEILRPLTLSERAIALALAMSLDNDYFSRHGGWGIPFIAVEE
ncbi:hypothetical protein Dimus_028107 [Dionaea muscipula]